MIFWEKVLLKYPMKLQASEEDTEFLPIVFSKWFVAYNQGERVIFVQLHHNCVWSVPPSKTCDAQQCSAATRLTKYSLRYYCS